MNIELKEHVGGLVVAAAIVAAALAQGLFEPTGYAAASVVIWAAVTAGLTGRFLPASRVNSSATIAGLCLAGTMILAMASVTWASDQGRAFEEAVRISFYLGLFTLAACTANSFGRSEWLGGLAVGLGIVSVLSVLAYLQPGLLNGGHNDVPNAAGRLSYPLGYWNGAAALLAIAAVLGLYASTTAPSRALRSIAVGVIPIAGLGIWLASSRGGALAVGAGLVVLVCGTADRLRLVFRIVIGAAGAGVLILAGHGMHALTSGVADSAMRTDGDRMSGLVLLVVLLVAAVAWTIDGARPNVRVSRRAGLAMSIVAGLAIAAAIVAANPAERFREFKAPPSANGVAAVSSAGLSSNGRWQFWSASVDAFENAPAGGIGSGGYEDWWAQHATAPLFVRNPHSLPLQQAAELGIGGVLLFAGFVVAVVLGTIRRFAAGLGGDAGVLAALVVVGAVGAAIDWIWEIPAAFGPAVIGAGLLTASAPSRGRTRDSYWLGAGAVAAAWLAIVAGGLVVLSELQLKQSRTDAAHQQFADGVQKAKDAHVVLPWSAEPYTQLALLDEARGDIGGALAYLRSAEARDSKDWRLPLIEARLQTRRGDRPAARAAIERARSLSPLLPIFNPQPSQG